jgi:hypothetical protein
MIRKRIIH